MRGVQNRATLRGSPLTTNETQRLLLAHRERIRMRRSSRHWHGAQKKLHRRWHGLLQLRRGDGFDAIDDAAPLATGWRPRRFHGRGGVLVPAQVNEGRQGRVRSGSRRRLSHSARSSDRSSIREFRLARDSLHVA